MWHPWPDVQLDFDVLPHQPLGIINTVVNKDIQRANVEVRAGEATKVGCTGSRAVAIDLSVFVADECLPRSLIVVVRPSEQMLDLRVRNRVTVIHHRVHENLLGQRRRQVLITSPESQTCCQPTTRALAKHAESRVIETKLVGGIFVHPLQRSKAVFVRHWMRVLRRETIPRSKERDPRRFDSGLNLLTQKLDRAMDIFVSSRFPGRGFGVAAIAAANGANAALNSGS